MREWLGFRLCLYSAFFLIHIALKSYQFKNFWIVSINKSESVVFIDLNLGFIQNFVGIIVLTRISVMPSVQKIEF
jgi:hypothetical protein